MTPAPAMGSYMSVDTVPGWGEGTVLVVSDCFNPIYVSGDGGHSWQARNGTVVSPKPVWWTDFPSDQLLSWGRNGIVATRADPSRWLIATGFGVAASTDGGETWGWSSNGIGEVCMYRCHSHPQRANWTFCPAMDLTGFFISDGGTSGLAKCVLRNGMPSHSTCLSSANAPPCSSSVFNHESSYWDVDYAKGAAWSDLSASGSLGISFAGNEQVRGVTDVGCSNSTTTPIADLKLLLDGRLSWPVDLLD